MGVQQQQQQPGGAPALLGGTAIKPVERKGFQAIRYFIHNPDTGEFFTRTPKSWALILIFYVIYYTCLAAFWYGLLVAFFSTLPAEHPKWTLDSGLIGNNPGLGLRPSQADRHIDSSMIRLSDKEKPDEMPSEDFESDSNVDWAKRAEVFMTQYNVTKNIVDCEDGAVHDDRETSCRFDPNVFGPCFVYPYGFLNPEISPCLFIKPNRIYDWSPQTFEVESLGEIEEMPQNVKDLISVNPDKLYVDCQGENPYDREGLEGKFTYYPLDQSIDFKHFPYIHVNGNYHNPAVALKIGDVERGRLYHIECRLWGQGIRHDRKHRKGLVHFEYIID